MPRHATPTRLRCEYLTNPLGLDVPRPRLFWQLESDREGLMQGAYQIVAATTPDRLDQPDLWDSGRVESEESAHVPYGGPELESRHRVWWRVRVWDERGEASAWSEVAFFEMGLLRPEDWQGEWIGADLSGGPRTAAPVPFLRKEVRLEGRVMRARLYATALGIYEFRINGRRVGDDWFAPGWTDYRKRIQYQVYDVADLLVEGPNALGAILGDGWFCGNVEWRGRQLYGDRPLLRAMLEVTYENGTTQAFATDASWKYGFGPLLEADLLMGESYDARKEMPGWDRPGFDEARWHPVVPGESAGGALVGMRGPTVKATEELRPIGPPRRIDRWPSPDFLFDLGQNMVGVVRLRVKGPAGATIRLRFGEMLTPQGTLYTENLRTARQTDYYTLKGDPEGEEWTPRFTFHGFRYVELRGLAEGIDENTITGIVLHSDTPKTGEFECSDALVNQLAKNIDWGQRGNFVDIPTDCPQRDERLGWTGDAQVFIRTAAFNRDVASFFTKWQNDLLDSQGEEGQIPPTAPTTGVVGKDGGPAWADAVVICPWTLYQCYGDKAILREHFPSILAFIGYLESTAIDHIRSHPEFKGFSGFGDWLNIKAETPHDLIGTAFFAYSARLAAHVAEVLEEEGEARRLRALFETVRAAFQRRFVTAEGLVTPQTQTAYILALHFDLLPEALRARAAQNLVDDIARRGWKLSAGFVGSPYINHVLTEAGRNDVAYRLLFQKQWPSWLYPVTKGATTIWERWDGWTEENGFQDPGMNSFNHYAYGAVGAWLVQHVAGIDLHPEIPAYKHIVFKPMPGEGLSHARATYDSLYGTIESAWRIDGDGMFHWQGWVPPNTRATLHLPFGGGSHELASGTHSFKVKVA